jgi:hypothetical protein
VSHSLSAVHGKARITVDITLNFVDIGFDASEMCTDHHYRCGEKCLEIRSARIRDRIRGAFHAFLDAAS